MTIAKLSKCSAALWLFAALVVRAAQGATIVDVSGPNDVTTTTSILSNNMMVGFTAATGYTNPSIAVSLLSFFGGGDWKLPAYLTDQVGPVITAANEIAATSALISIPDSPLFPPYTITPYNVFSRLTLPAGTHYLILSGTSQTANVWWVASPAGIQSVITDLGASVINPFAFGSLPDPYLPASFFVDFQNLHLWFTVTGDAVAEVPEPSTLLLAAP